MGGEVLGYWVQSLTAIALKVVTVAFSSLYLLFSFFLLRQTKLLNTQLKTQFSPLTETFALIHFLLGILAFVFALFYWQNYGKGLGF